MTRRGASYVAAMLLAAAPVAAQDAGGYRAALDACLVTENYACAFEAIMSHVEPSVPKPPVAVSVKSGATILGAQLYTVIDRAKTRVPAQQWHDMTVRAATYAVDAQPMEAYASGPFLMLYGEACLELGDMGCLGQVAQSLRFLLDANQWYVAGETGTRERAEALLAAFQEKTK